MASLRKIRYGDPSDFRAKTDTVLRPFPAGAVPVVVVNSMPFSRDRKSSSKKSMLLQIVLDDRTTFRLAGEVVKFGARLLSALWSVWI